MISREDKRDAIRWALCAAIILLAHGGVAYAVVNWRDPVEDAVPAGAIAIELEPMPVSTTQEEKELAPAPEQVQSEAVPEKPVEVKKEEPAPEIPEAPNPEVAVAAVPPKPEVEPEKEPEKKPVEPEKKPEPKPRSPAPTTTAPQAQKKVAARSAAPADAPSQASASAIATWKGRLSAHLERHKRAHGDRGIAILSFTVDQGGRVVGSRLAKSSGSAALDREALSLIQRAAPVPPPPPGIPGGRVSISVPLQYNMR